MLNTVVNLADTMMIGTLGATAIAAVGLANKFFFVFTLLVFGVVSGSGVLARVDGVQVAAGNDKLMRHLGIPHIDCHQTGTIIHMAVNGAYAGTS